MPFFVNLNNNYIYNILYILFLSFQLEIKKEKRFEIEQEKIS